MITVYFISMFLAGIFVILANKYRNEIEFSAAEDKVNTMYKFLQYVPIIPIINSLWVLLVLIMMIYAISQII